MAIIGELLGELVLVALNLTVGLGLAAMTYWLWLTVRRRLWGLDRSIVAETPDGLSYSLDVEGQRLRMPISRRILRTDKTRDAAPPSWQQSDRLHPGNMAGTFDSLLIFVIPVVLVVVLMLAIVFVVEVIFAVIILGIVSTIGVMIRHRWTCVVTGPGGEVSHVRIRGLRRVRRLRDQLADAIRAGDVASVKAAAAD